MDTSSAVGRRRVNSRVNAEDQALDQIAKEVNMSLFYYYYFLIPKEDKSYVPFVNVKKTVLMWLN